MPNTPNYFRRFALTAVTLAAGAGFALSAPTASADPCDPAVAGCVGADRGGAVAAAPGAGVGADGNGARADAGGTGVSADHGGASAYVPGGIAAADGGGATFCVPGFCANAG